MTRLADVPAVASAAGPCPPDDAVAELEAYLAPRFRWDLPLPKRFPLADELSATAWSRYETAARAEGAFAVLNRALPQLQFPVAEGMSTNPTYQAATRRGAPGRLRGMHLRLRHPEAVRLALHPTPAGRLPAVTVGDRGDFERLLQALTKKNEPMPIPRALGATIVAGYNNWDRIAEIRAAWVEQQGGDDPLLWAVEFKRIQADRAQYQDCFALISSGPYSGVPASELGLGRSQWDEMSIQIRLLHEGVHFFTRRVLGSMKNLLHDEVIADFVGIRSVVGRYRADWFLRFMGLEDDRRYRPGGRLESYRGDPPLSDAAFELLQTLVRAAAGNLEVIANRRRTAWLLDDQARWILALARIGLVTLASDRAAEALDEAFH